MRLNPKTVVGAKSRPTKLVRSLDFRPGLPNFNEVIKAIENVTSLKGKIFVNVKQGHFVISVLKNIDATSIEKEFLNKGDELAKKLKKSFVWEEQRGRKIVEAQNQGSLRSRGCGVDPESFCWPKFSSET